VKCTRCEQESPEAQTYVYRGEDLCEDCYLEAVHRVQACDPWAVHHAKRTRESLAMVGGEGLSQVQRGLYEFIVSRGKAEIEEAMQTFGLSARELESELAILRHCELVKAHKESGRLYLVPFWSGS
jgi:recombinational DNA repair protein (RecF pathway)